MAILETMVSVASGGFFALLGGWLTYKYNSRAIKENRNFEKWKSNRDLYLSKGQELCDLLGQWVIASSKLTTMYNFRAMGVYNREQFNERVKNIETEGVIPRMLSLVDIYFPESSDSLLSLQRTIADAHTYYVSNFKDGADNTRVIEVLDTALINFAKHSEIFKKELVNEIKRHIS